MSMNDWEKKVLKAPGARARVAELEDELRLASGLTSLREEAGLSQRELAHRMGITQPRVAAIEQSRNVTIDVLEQYVAATGGRLEMVVVKGKKRVPLSPVHKASSKRAQARRSKQKLTKNKGRSQRSKVPAY